MEQAEASTSKKLSNPSYSNASFALVDPRKRKKDVEMTEGATARPRLDLAWKQTEEEVNINAKIDAKDGDLHKVEVTFTDRQMTITLPDGDQQSWCFHGAVDRTRSKVSRSKRRFHMTMVKKEQGLWPALEASEPVSDSASSEQQQQQEQEQEPGMSEELPEASSPNNEMPDSLQDLRTKEEEPVFNLDYIKHDYYEVEDMITIHMYVTSVSKDVVKVHFDKQFFTVKFQTGDQRFLDMHEGTSEETVFCWTVKTKGVIIPSGCVWKTRNKYIELRLKKTSAQKWEGLEASMRKETTSSTKTTSWMPATQNTWAATATTSKGNNSSSGGIRGSSVVFDELSQMTDNRSGLDPSTETPASSSPLSSASVKGQKPMAKVQPLNTQVVTQERRVGYTGLVNIGNTCYLNSVIQVLANTAELRDYFIQGHYKEHINSKSGGDLARCFATLMKTLWNGTDKYITPNRLKEMVSQRDSPFQGLFQHDAQEFLSYLLNRLHEDVNRAKRPQLMSKEEKSDEEKKGEEEGGAESKAMETNGEMKDDGAAGDSANKPVHVIAEEKWSAHKKREDSFLVDLMHGQYKNKITCPSCKEVSTTFEPFSILPLALPRNKKTVFVTFMWRDAQRKPIKYRIQLVKEPSVEHLTEQLSHKTGVHPKNMRVFEVKNSLFYRRFKASSDLSRMDLKDTIIVSEVLSADDAGEEVVEMEVIQRLLHPPFPVICASCKQECQTDKRLRRCTSCFKVGYCNQVCQRNHWVTHKHHCNKGPEPVGCPFLLSLPRSHCTHGRVARLMETFARYSVDIFQPPVKTDPVTITTPPAPTPPPPSSSSSTSSSTPTPTPKPSSGSAGGTMLPPSAGGDLHLPSHPSGSNLSSSSGSQSSGSLSSLDSISSCSSTATLTAETPHATFDVGHSEEEEEGEGGERKEERGAGDVDSGLGSISSLQSGGLSQASNYGNAQGDWKPEADQDKDCSGSQNTERSGAGSNVQSVAASMSSDRSVSHFFIKPVDAEGRGKRVDRLEDKGDTVLDMSDNRYLSLDWRNNENQPCYVLVQSKELEAEEDDSVKNPRYVSETLTLQQCLDMYHAPEILSDRNAWTCDKCKRKQEAHKQCFLWKLPHIFIVQLKRFTNFDFFSRKVDTKVDFPVRGLDLTPYKFHHDESPALYDLYGVISHIGNSALGGHYTCRARCVDPTSPFKNEVEWRLFDDVSVTPINNEKSVVDQNAYVLFYRRRLPFDPPPIVHPVTAPEDNGEQEVTKEGVREKSEEESKEMRMDVEQSFVKSNGKPRAGAEGGKKGEKDDDDDDDNQEEKQDPEKDADADRDCFNEGGRLVIDMDDSQPDFPPLDYTDMDAVD